jgi:tetratricopeptide (TPR) repeat protein
MSATRDIQAVLREKVIPAGASRHGLVVGVERYRDSRLDLRCARADAQAIYDLMTDPECGLFPKENVKLLLDEEATTDNIWRSLTKLRKAAVPSDMVWIFFAGHAAFEGSRFFWVTHDADIDDLFSTALDKERFDTALNEIHASRVIVLLDCCHAAATKAQKNPTRFALTPEQLFDTYKGEGRITLASSDGKEKSVELGDQGHGAFTYFLKKGLRGEADSDGDGVVTANELWDYLRNKVTEASIKAGNFQTPVLLGQMTHDLALTLNPMATQHKRRIEEVLRQHVGWDEKQELTTAEGAWCRKLIHSGPQSDDEWAVYEELERLVEGQARIGTIKRLVKIASHAKTKPDVAAKVSPAVAPVSRVCPSCGKFLKVQAFCAGQDVPCPGCKSLLHVPADRSTLTIVQPPPQRHREQSPNAKNDAHTAAQEVASPRIIPEQQRKDAAASIPTVQNKQAAATAPVKVALSKSERPIIPPPLPQQQRTNEQPPAYAGFAKPSINQRRLLAAFALLATVITVACVISAAGSRNSTDKKTRELPVPDSTTDEVVKKKSEPKPPEEVAKQESKSPAELEAEQHIESVLSAPLHVTGLEYTDQPLQDVVSQLQDEYGIPIQLDKVALEEAAIGSDVSISINLHNISLRSGLRLMLRQQQLAYVIQDEVLMITTEEKAAELRDATGEQDRNATSSGIPRPLSTTLADAQAHYVRGNIFYDKFEYDNALSEYTAAIRLNPNDARFYIERGNTWDENKQPEKALADYGEALRLDPRSGSAFLNRAVIWIEKKDYDKALNDFNDGIRLEPRNALARCDRGYVLSLKNDNDNAMADYNEAIRLDPKMALAYHNRGDVWLDKKQYDKAINDYSEAIRLDPTAHKRQFDSRDSTYVRRGIAWSLKKEDEKALADYDRAIRLDPKNITAYNAIAWIRATCENAKWRDGKQAIGFASRACELTNWKNSLYLDTLAAAYAETGDFNKARLWQQKAVADPNFEKMVGGEEFLAAKARLELYQADKPFRKTTAARTASGDIRYDKNADPFAN